LAKTAGDETRTRNIQLGRLKACDATTEKTETYGPPQLEDSLTDSDCAQQPSLIVLATQLAVLSDTEKQQLAKMLIDDIRETKPEKVKA